MDVRQLIVALLLTGYVGQRMHVRMRFRFFFQSMYTRWPSRGGRQLVVFRRRRSFRRRGRTTFCRRTHTQAALAGLDVAEDDAADKDDEERPEETVKNVRLGVPLLRDNTDERLGVVEAVK